MDQDAEAPRLLQYFPVDIGRYDHHPPLNTQAEVAGVAELLAPFGAETEAWDIDEERGRGMDAVDERLRAWSNPQTPSDTFLYWAGHGVSDGQSALLAHARSPHPLATGGLTPETVVHYLAARQAHRHANGSWAIVVIDACRSARFVQLMSAKAYADSTGGPRNVLLVSTSEEGSTDLGKFRKALSAALTVSFPAEDTIGLGTLALELTRNLYPCPVISHIIAPDAALHRKVPALAGALTAPLDLLAEIEAVLATFTDDERRYFVSKASGAELGEQSLYFEGRADERHQVLTWLNTARSGLLVVTGAAGSGKSALLSHILIHTRPELCRLLERADYLDPLPNTTPRLREPFDAVLHFTGTTPQDVVARIASAAALGTPPTDPSLTVQTDWLYDRMRQADRPFTLLADALDEARLPLVTAEHILRRIASLDHVRVVVGTRRSTTEGPDLPQPDDQDLLDALGMAAATTADVISVGRDRDAVTRYVRRRLTAAAHVHADQFATAIGALDREFLYARLVVHEITQNPSLFRTLDGLELLLASDHRQLFARAVDRLASLAPANRPLLEALALAQGHGLTPHNGIWAAAATAISDGVTISDADIEALKQVASPYLMLDKEFGQTIYRLAHRTFAEHFASSWPHDLRHHRITARLAADANDLLPSAPLNPYLVRYLPTHAALGGPTAWEELASRLRVLGRLDPTVITANVMLHAFGRFELPPAIAGVVGSQHQLATAGPHDRQGIRELASTRYTDQFAPDDPDLARHDQLSAWSVRWARMQRHSLHLTLTGHTGAVLAVAAFTDPGGHTLLATGGEDGLVRIWDPATGIQAAPLTGHTDAVWAVAAFTDPGGHTLLATGGQDGLVRIWDPATGTQTTTLTGHTDAVLAVAAFTSPDGQTLLATGSSDGTVRIWDPATGTQTTTLTGHTDAVLAVAAFTSPDGQTLLATGGYDGPVRVWDPATRTLTATLTGHTGGVWAVAWFLGPEGRSLLAIGSDDRPVQVWDPATRTLTATLTGHTAMVYAVAVFHGSDERTLLATGSNDETVRVWNPATGTLTATFTGHTGLVRAVARFTGPNGRTLLATGSSDGTVRIWDPTTSTQTGHSDGVRAVAWFTGPDGRTLLATGSSDGTVRIWDPTTGTQTTTLTGHTGLVYAVAAFTSPNGRTLLATGSSDGTVRIWDPTTSTQTTTLTGHTGLSTLTGPVLAVAAFTSPDERTLLATGSEDGMVRIWDPTTGTQTTTLTGHTGPVYAVAAFTSPDERTLLATGSSDGTVRIWDPTTSTQTTTLTGHTDWVRAVAVFAGADGRTLLATGSSDGTVRIWDPTTSTQTTTLTGHTDWVRAVAVFAGQDGRTLLATGGGDGTVRLWDPANGFGCLVVPLDIAVLDIASLGTELAVGTAEGVILISVVAAALEMSLPS